MKTQAKTYEILGEKLMKYQVTDAYGQRMKIFGKAYILGHQCITEQLQVDVKLWDFMFHFSFYIQLRADAMVHIKY